MSSQKSLEQFISLLDHYKQVAFPTNVEELSPTATFELFETVYHVKSIPDQVTIKTRKRRESDLTNLHTYSFLASD
jgi:hypothetical protein